MEKLKDKILRAILISSIGSVVTWFSAYYFTDDRIIAWITGVGFFMVVMCVYLYKMIVWVVNKEKKKVLNK